MPKQSESSRKSPGRGDLLKWDRLRDVGVATAFAGVVAVLLLIACYVASRLAGERAYREKWRDYNDCGWA